MIKIKDNSIFVEGRKTNDPMEIGYAFIDLAEKHNSLDLENIKSVSFNLKEIVYVITDGLQEPRIITGIVIRPSGQIHYMASNKGVETEFYEFELSAEKIIF